MEIADLKTATDEQLALKFRETATNCGEAMRDGHPKLANLAFDYMIVILRELSLRGTRSMTVLLPLLGDEDKWTRLHAATALLFYLSENACPVLEELCREGRSLGFTAEMTLKQWRAGKLREFWNPNAERHS